MKRIAVIDCNGGKLGSRLVKVTTEKTRPTLACRRPNSTAIKH